MKVSGNITLGGNLALTFANGYSPTGASLASFVVGGANVSLEKYFILSGDTGLSGVFGNQVTTGNIFNGLVPTVVLGGRQFAISYTGLLASNSLLGGHDVVLVPIAVPEAGVWRMLILGTAVQLGASRFFRRSR